MAQSDDGADDLYAVLDVAPSATHEQLRRAHRRLVRRFHPDAAAAGGGDRWAADQRIRAINGAWAVLGSPERRQRYDAERARGTRGGRSRSAPAHDRLRLARADAVLGRGFTLKLTGSGAMTTGSWGFSRTSLPLQPPLFGLAGAQWFLLAWTQDLSPLRKLYPGEVYGLQVDRHLIDDHQMPHIASLDWLEVLSLEDNPVTDEGISCLGSLVHLWSLDLGATKVTDAGCRTVGTLASLQELSLADTAITDAAVPDLLRLQRLRMLNIRGTRITDDAVIRLTALPALRELAVPGSLSWRTRRVLRRLRRDLALV